MNSLFHSKLNQLLSSILCAVMIFLSLGGCAPLLQGTGFLTRMREDFESDYLPDNKKVELLKPVPKNREAVRLEIFLIEKPLFDPLMGKKLWQEVDQIAGIDVSVRENLKKNGFRIGRVSSRPPVALQSLLGITSESDDSRLSRSKGLKGREIFVTPGAESVLLTGSTKSECQFHVENRSKIESEEFQNANCAFRVQVERLQDGFANLKFIPEIRHGDNVYRHLATEKEWVGRTSQDITPFFQQQFELNLNIGEMVVISADLDEAGSIGNTFFVSDENDRIPLQRILVVRLADMKNIVPLYPEE